MPADTVGKVSKRSLCRSCVTDIFLFQTITCKVRTVLDPAKGVPEC